MTCDAGEQVFACGYPSECETNNFTIDGGNAFVLRPDQAQKLQLGDSAFTISPFTTLDAQRGSQDNQLNSTATACANNSADTGAPGTQGSSEATFTAAQVVGVGLGVGLPLLLALVGAGVVIWRQRQTMQTSKSDVAETDQQTTKYTQLGKSPASPLGPPSALESGGQHISEVDALPKRQEIGGAMRQELPAYASSDLPFSRSNMIGPTMQQSQGQHVGSRYH